MKKSKILGLFWLVITLVWVAAGVLYLKERGDTQASAATTSVQVKNISEPMLVVSPETPSALTFFEKSPVVVAALSEKDVQYASILSTRLNVPIVFGDDKQVLGSTVDSLGASTLIIVSSDIATAVKISEEVSFSERAEVLLVQPLCADAGEPCVVPESVLSDRADLSQAFESVSFIDEEKENIVDTLLEQEKKQADESSLVVVSGAETVASEQVFVSNALAAGHQVIEGGGDLRSNKNLFALLETNDVERFVLQGDSFDSSNIDLYVSQIDALREGYELPGGGLLIQNPVGEKQKYYVALYGSPNTGGLGVLGEQDVDATVERVKELAEEYRDVDSENIIVPTLEIITTVASQYPNPDNSYSTKTPIADIQPLVDAAADEGIYVVLDLQPGRTHFLEQAKAYEPLLKLPHVGLALDPEWRLLPNQVHLRQIGSVTAEEINEVGEWLATLVAEEGLPQKMFLLHQFNLKMIQDREDIDTSYEELTVVIQMDGQGSQPSKVDTYNVLLEGAPKGILFGWKNFYDEDSPAPLSPEQTFAIDPKPFFVSYQ